LSYRYAIIGTGRQGLSAAFDLARFGAAEEILLCDLNIETARKGAEKLRTLIPKDIFKPVSLDAGNHSQLVQTLKGINSAISAVPFTLNLGITEAAIECSTNLCDLGGHTETVLKQLALDESAKSSGVTVVPDCGMGPGLNISLGVLAMSFVEKPINLFIWDGGLPQNPVPPWNYVSTFHINGLTNEYEGPAWFIRDGKPTQVPCLSEVEALEFPSPLGHLEAAVTSGGLSTAPWTFAGKLQRLENKTLRYPGHWKMFQAYQQLGLFEQNSVGLKGGSFIPREVFHTLLQPKISSDTVRDICVIRVRCEGEIDGTNASCTLDLCETYDEKTGLTAMEKFTGWHASMVAILSAQNKLPKGAVPIEIALSGPMLMEEAQKRSWAIKNNTLLKGQ
jgi:lysine 6-dehydrogenase